MKTDRFIFIFILPVILLIISLLYPPQTLGCPDCWGGYGPGEERYNKPLADLRIIYENHGDQAIDAIHEAFISSKDHLVKQRAIDYIVQLNATGSIPLLEKELYELIKRVSWSAFGVGTPEYDTRVKVAQALAGFGANTIADKLWFGYENLDRPRKSEIPYILFFLNEPLAVDRTIEILNNEKDHILILGALEVLSLAADEKAIPAIRDKMHAWDIDRQFADSKRRIGALEFTIRHIKAQKAIDKIEYRIKNPPAPQLNDPDREQSQTL